MGTAAINGPLWGARAQEWADLQEITARPVWERMLERAAVGQSTIVLDVGCGAGNAAALAAARGATVTGVDASAGLVKLARERASGTFVTGEMEELPFPDQSFDVVLSTNALQYAADRDRAASELARVAKATGRICIGMWAEPERNEMSVLFAAVRKLVPPDPNARAPLDLSQRDVLIGLLTRNGIALDEDGIVQCIFLYNNDDHYWRAQRSAGVMEAAAAKVGEETLRAALMDAAAPYRQADGRIVFINHMRYVLGRRAESNDGK